ncbi:MAG: hypothetical protein V4787_03535 [Pseudomonadota bacterium]
MKIRVSVVRFRPRPPDKQRLRVHKDSGAFLQLGFVFYNSAESRQQLLRVRQGAGVRSRLRANAWRGLPLMRAMTLASSPVISISSFAPVLF